MRESQGATATPRLTHQEHPACTVQLAGKTSFLAPRHAWLLAILAKDELLQFQVPMQGWPLVF